MTSFTLTFAGVLLGLGLSAFAEPATFEGHQVFRMTPSNDVQLEFLRDLEARDLDLDFWKSPTILGLPVDIRIHPKKIPDVEDALMDVQLGWYVMVEDVQADSILTFLRDNSVDNVCPIGSSNGGLEQYEDYAATISRVRSLASQYSDITRLVDLGTSVQGREILGIVIDIGGASKPHYFIDGGIHAREWISPATVKNVLIALLEGYTRGDAVATRMLTQFTWTIVPIVNPDGYQFTWTNNRMWRKNRGNSGNPSCVGIDLNRNSDIDFTGSGSSTNPCSDAFRGPSAFSEPETRAISSYANSLPGLKAYWNIHSYGQDIFIPWGYTNAAPPDRTLHQNGANVMRDAIRATNGMTYSSGPDFSTVSGDLSDWIYRNTSAVYTGVLELRDTGRYGFQLPASFICPTSQEIFAGLAAHSDFVFNN